MSGPYRRSETEANTYLEDGHYAGELPNELDMPVVANAVRGNIPRCIVLVDKVVPTDVHACQTVRPVFSIVREHRRTYHG